MPFRGIDDPAKLRRLLESVFLLEEDLSLPTLLRHLVAEACAMTGARYGALGVLDESHSALSEFITVGLDEDTEADIGARPTGRGVLGLLITDPRPLRLADLSTDPDTSGFPPGHPPMTSFLGVPVATKSEVYGNLYLTDKIGWSEFTTDDEAMVVALAQAAGIAIENARLHQRVQDVAVFDDRDRIARELHDAIIQRLFAIGLSLQSIARSGIPSPIAVRLNQAIADLDQTIINIRSSIFGLAAGGPAGPRAGVLSVTEELSGLLGFGIATSFDGPVDTAIDEDLTIQILAVLREALTNVARHARATAATVRMEIHEERCTLTVADNGVGIEMASETSEGGLGLVNMRHRAEKFRGEVTLTSSPESGTLLTWSVPVGAGQ